MSSTIVFEMDIDLDSTPTNVTQWLIRVGKVPHNIIEEFRGVTGQEILGFTANELEFSGMEKNVAEKVYKKLRHEEYHDEEQDDNNKPIDNTDESVENTNGGEDYYPDEEPPFEPMEEALFMDYEMEEIRDLDREAELLWPSSQADWISLTNEMWVNIFSLVEFWSLAMVLTRVCSKFRTICHELVSADVTLRLFPPGRINDESLMSLVDRFFNIQSLNLHGHKVTLHCINRIGENSRQRLKSLNFSRTPTVGDDWLKKIGQTFPQLETMQLASCGLVGKSGIAALADSCHNLKLIDLSYCVKLDDDALGKLGKCVKLQNVNVHGCTLISDAGIKSLVQNNTSLMHLSLKMCDKITDKGIAHLTKYCRNLRTLDMYGCKQITNTAIEQIAHNLVHLESLILRFCPLVTEDGTDTLRELNPTCDVRDF